MCVCHVPCKYIYNMIVYTYKTSRANCKLLSVLKIVAATCSLACPTGWKMDITVTDPQCLKIESNWHRCCLVSITLNSQPGRTSNHRLSSLIHSFVLSCLDSLGISYVSCLEPFSAG